MRLSKYFSFLCIITYIGLLYTHQQFAIIKANYDIKKYETQLSQLLDHNKKLRYNVNVLESPTRLEARLVAKGMDYDVPRQWAVVKGEKSKSAYELAKVPERRKAVERILNFMTAKAEAQAHEIQ